MRRHLMIAALLAASAAVPALAQQQTEIEHHHGHGNDGEAPGRSGEIPFRGRPDVRSSEWRGEGRWAGRDRGGIDMTTQAQPQGSSDVTAGQVIQAQMGGDRRGGRWSGERGEWRGTRAPVDAGGQAQARTEWQRRDGDERGSHRHDRDDGRRDGGQQWGGQQWGGQRQWRGEYRDGQLSPFGRSGGAGYYRQPEYRGGNFGYRYDPRGGGWDRDWRRDQRYDWQRYRYANRSLFQVGRYYPPYGYSYGYNRFSIGVVLGSAFFGSNYWINDPYAYRLPAAYEPYRWVRYYNDVLLIDVRSGYVVDVIYDFFS